MKERYVDLIKTIYRGFGLNEFRFRDIAKLEHTETPRGAAMRVLKDHHLVKITKHEPADNSRFTTVYRVTDLGAKFATGVVKRMV